MKKITQDEYQKRLDRITEIFSDMVEQADEQSNFRCPYRNRHDECTAKIRCRSQQSPRDGGTLQICGHNGTFDYRDAWDSNPQSVDRARQRVDRIRKQADERRKGNDSTSRDQPDNH